MTKEVKKSHKVRKVILSVAIAILFVMFIAYAIESVYPSPKYERYCPSPTINPVNESECTAVNGTWIVYPVETMNGKQFPAGVSGYCDTYTECAQPWEDAQESYNRNLFFISIIIGLIVVVLSLVFSVEAVGSGLMGGGVLLMIYGTIRYWGALSDILRTVMIGIALGILIWIGYRKLR